MKERVKKENRQGTNRFRGNQQDRQGTNRGSGQAAGNRVCGQIWFGLFWQNKKKVARGSAEKTRYEYEYEYE